MNRKEGAIDKTVNTFYDGKQFMIKIPTEISNYLNIKKGYKIRFFVSTKENVLESTTSLTVIPAHSHKKKKRGKGYGKKKKRHTDAI